MNSAATEEEAPPVTTAGGAGRAVAGSVSTTPRWALDPRVRPPTEAELGALNERRPVPLRTVQLHGMSALAAAVLRGERRPLMVIATGGGKTVAFASAPFYLERYTGYRVRRSLVLAHRDELIDQAAKTWRRVDPSARVAILAGGRSVSRLTLLSADVIVAGVDTLGNDKRLLALPRDFFDFLVIDEAHHAAEGSRYEKIARHFGAFDDGGPLLTGWTATPMRGDGKSLAAVFTGVAYQKTLMDGMREGWLAPARPLMVPISIDLLKAGRGKDFSETQLAALMDDPRVTATMLGRYLAVREQWLAEKGRAPHTIAFAVTRKHAHNVVAAWRAAGVDARYVGGDLRDTERADVIAAFARREFEVLVSISIATEGFDVASVDVGVDLKPTRSATLMTQMFGRVLRLHEDKTEAVYLQVLPEHHQEAGMVTVADLEHLTLDWTPDQIQALVAGPLHEAVERLDEAQRTERAGEVARAVIAAAELAPEEAQTFVERAKAEALALRPDDAKLLVPVLPSVFKDSDVLWESHADGTFAVPLGAVGTLTIHPHDAVGQHRVVLTTREGAARVLGADVALDRARRLAERWLVREHPEDGRLYLKSQAERWMNAPATEAQRTRVRLAVPHLPAEQLSTLRRGVAYWLLRTARSARDAKAGKDATAATAAAGATMPRADGVQEAA